jgi:hypothetical protein
MFRLALPALLTVLFPIAFAALGGGGGDEPRRVAIRVATFNVGDIRTADLDDPEHPRLLALAEVIQRLRPNVLLLNEIAWDGPGAPGYRAGEPEGQNGQRFADRFLAVRRGDWGEAETGGRPLRYRAFMAAVNSGVPSGLDLNRDGRVVTAYPSPPFTLRREMPPEPSSEARAYGEDCWGFGTFPGQYGMALLVDERLVIDLEGVRTFRLLPWDYMPGALLPRDAGGAGGDHWYGEEARSQVRLSSRSHWDVPVHLPNGATMHFLCSHPTPPGFEGPEKRNARRNRDEIRFWADYIDDAQYIVDDRNKPGGLPPGRPFIILGDLNVDPARGESFRDPIGSLLCSHRRINCLVVPTADLEIEGLAATDTTRSGLRVDYILPSRDLGIAAAGVYRHVPAGTWRGFPSDHFPVWMEIVALPPDPGP